MYARCAGLDVHKETVVACVRIAEGSEVSHAVRTFTTTTASLIELGEWLETSSCTHIAMEATGVYWKPVWQVLADGSFELVLANAAHVKNVPGRKTDVNDATWLSELLAHGLVRASFVPEPEICDGASCTNCRTGLPPKEWPMCTRRYARTSTTVATEAIELRRKRVTSATRCVNRRWLNGLDESAGCRVISHLV
jgi:hypothetical protein